MGSGQGGERRRAVQASREASSRLPGGAEVRQAQLPILRSPEGHASPKPIAEVRAAGVVSPLRRPANFPAFRRVVMTGYKLISADSHIVEPPDLYKTRIEPKFRTRAPRMERHRTRVGSEYDAWYFEGTRVGTVGSVIQAVSGSKIRRRSTFSASGKMSGKRPTSPTPCSKNWKPTACGPPACNRTRDTHG